MSFVVINTTAIFYRATMTAPWPIALKPQVLNMLFSRCSVFICSYLLCICLKGTVQDDFHHHCPLSSCLRATAHSSELSVDKLRVWGKLFRKKTSIFQRDPLVWAWNDMTTETLKVGTLLGRRAAAERSFPCRVHHLKRWASEVHQCVSVRDRGL